MKVIFPFAEHVPRLTPRKSSTPQSFFLRPAIWQIGQSLYVRDISFSTLTAGTIPAERILQVSMPNGEVAYEKEPAVFPKRKKDAVILDVSSKEISQGEADEVQTFRK